IVQNGFVDVPSDLQTELDRLVHTARNRRSQPKGNTKNARVPTFKKNVSSDMVNASSTGLVHTARNRRSQPKGNTKNARVPSASMSGEVKKNVTVEDHHRILLLSKN
nr:hypothetical protein [Tanacetum cinerariifolium]